MDNNKLPAYPRFYAEMNAESWEENAGFTKLELASLMAMQGMLGNPFMMQALWDDALQNDETDVFKVVAKSSVAYAKFVLEEANK